MASKKSPKKPRRRRKVIPPPSGDKEPLKVNVYYFVNFTKTALAPLFPYFDEGSIVPCSATFRGGPKVNYSRFQHFNTVDEILLTFGAAGSMRSGGVLRVGPRLHMVQSPLTDDANPENLTLSVITQRQSVGKPQKEEYRFVCKKCDRRLFAKSFDATPAKRGKQKKVLGAHGLFATIPESYKAANEFNADPKTRICKHCGHKNKPFPTDAWGWKHYVEQSEISSMAYDAMLDSQKGPQPIPPGKRK